MGRNKKENAKRKLCCVVPGCKSDTRKDEKKHKFMEGVEFYPFPTKLKDNALRKKWLKMINRPADYDPKPYHRVCSRHFVGGKKTSENCVPELFPSNNFKQPLKERPMNAINKREIIVPVRRKGTSAATTRENISTVNTRLTAPFLSIYEEKDIVKDVPLPIKEVEVTESFEETPICPELEDHLYCRAIASAQYPTYSDVQTQTCMESTDIDDLYFKLKQEQEKTKSDEILRDKFLEKVVKTDRSICFYTGIPNLNMFNGMFKILDNFEKNIKYWYGSDSINEKQYEEMGYRKPGPKRKLSRYHEYTLTLIRLRHAIPERMLSDIFGVSVSRISQIFSTWIFYMYYVLKDLIIWPSRELVKKHMPKSFKKSFPNTRAIIDCTEMFIHRPRNPSNQAKTYSTYKSHNTYKSLVSITPNGCFNYISDLACMVEILRTDISLRIQAFWTKYHKEMKSWQTVGSQ